MDPVISRPTKTRTRKFQWPLTKRIWRCTKSSSNAESATRRVLSSEMSLTGEVVSRWPKEEALEKAAWIRHHHNIPLDIHLPTLIFDVAGFATSEGRPANVIQFIKASSLILFYPFQLFFLHEDLDYEVARFWLSFLIILWTTTNGAF